MFKAQKLATGKIGKSLKDRRQLAIQLFEKLAGRKATEKETAELDQTAKQSPQTKK